MPLADEKCPHCAAALPERASDAAETTVCPLCGAALDGPPPKPAPRESRPGEWNRNPIVMAVVGVIAVVALGVAVVKVVGLRREEALRRAAEARAEPEPLPKRFGESAAGQPAVAGQESRPGSSRLMIVRGGKIAGGRAALVALHWPDASDIGAGSRGGRQGLLARELIRQAVLIAARDELGLATRDEVLGDTRVAEPDGGAAVEVAPVFAAGAPSRAVIRRVTGESVETLLDHDLGTIMATVDPGAADRSTPDDLVKLVETAEAMSRREVPGVLRTLGVEGHANASCPDAPLPDWVEAALSRKLGYCEPLAAVRWLHAAIGKDGESATRLGALVRGYAMLGVLSEFHWHPAHKAFKARALLYAQRLVARDPKDPRGLWHRAYAEALVGLHQRALDDLGAARERAADVTLPAWVDLIEALARCDARALETLAAKEAQAPLAALLRLTIVEFPTLPGISLPAARQVLATNPECYRACDAICQVPGVSNQHEGTVLGPQALDQLFPRGLKAAPWVLPEAVRTQLETSEGASPALVSALRAAGDPAGDDGEPSWSVLAHLVRETRFVQVYRRLFFMARVWGVPVDDEWAAMAPTVAGHRFRTLLDLYVLPPQQALASVSAFAAKLDVSDLEFSEMDMARAFSEVRSLVANGAYDLASRHADHVARDLSLAIRDANSTRGRSGAVGNAWMLLAVSPHSAQARATLIEKDADRVKDRAAQWAKDSVGSPAVIGALAKRAVASNQPDEAIRLLERSVALAPEAWAYEALAKIYKDRGDRQRWKASLDAFLEVPDESGLEHARIRVEIANALMAEKRWREAWPYAEAAAQSWAGWAMRSAQQCAEGMGDFETAELWYRHEAERYPGSWGVWFMFCKRTGRGDVQAARALADRALQALGDRPDLNRPDLIRSDWLGFYYWLTDRADKALDPLGHAYERNPDAPSCCYPILVADKIGDAAARDRWLRAFKERYGAAAPKSLKAFELLFPNPSSASGAPAADVKAIDTLLESIKPEGRGNTSFFVGVYLANHGRPDEARKYLRMCGDGTQTLPWMRIVAADLLRRAEREAGSKK